MGTLQYNWQKEVHLDPLWHVSFGKLLSLEKRSVLPIFAVFSPLHFVAGTGNIKLLQMILQHSKEDIDKHDGSDLTPVMVSVISGHTEVFHFLIDAGADMSMNSRDGQSVVSMLHDYPYAVDGTRFKEILLDCVLGHRLTSHPEFRALHFAAWIDNLPAMTQLLEMGYPMNDMDDTGHSPLMLEAKEGHADVCKLLMQGGADCGISNCRGETALSLARNSKKCKAAERVIFDYLARSHVLLGEELWKQTHEGRGSPHRKVIRMFMFKSGMLSWGKSSRRNVVCKEAVAGPSADFLKNRRKGLEDRNNIVFRVTTETCREIHFEASSPENSELWVRGINFVIDEASSVVW